MDKEIMIQIIRRKYALLSDGFNERSRRHWAAAEAMVMGYGGLSLVSEATGLAHNTIRSGIRELEAQSSGQEETLPEGRIRHPGGGRKQLTEKDPTLLSDLDRLMDPLTRGDPESALRWTSKSTGKIAEALCQQQHIISPDTVGRLLTAQGYSLQSTRKRFEGKQHPDRDGQFQYIATTVRDFHDRNQPVISVDTKKKELIGNFKNGGREWERRGKPVEVNVYDFVDKELGKAIPYGVYDILHNEGWVSVGIDHDTAQFAVASIRTWWEHMGKTRYPRAKELLVTCDGGGSNGRRSKLWKVELQKLSDELSLTIRVCHFPPGTSKWNRIEHRMFSFISKNWRGKPLLDRATVVNLIAGTSTKTGLRIDAALDTNTYPTKIKVPDAEMKKLNLHTEDFHGEWNYRLEPR
jgi:hypothetical protein